MIVCFWAEVVHLRDIRWDKPQFLSKSFLAFVVFNIITYSLLFADFITAQMYSQKDQVSNKTVKVERDEWFMFITIIFHRFARARLYCNNIGSYNFFYLFQSFYTHVFNGCYAVLLFIVVVFFLIYGVEVFFKVCFLSYIIIFLWQFLYSKVLQYFYY